MTSETKLKWTFKDELKKFGLQTKLDSGGKLTLPAQLLFFSRISRRAVHHCIKEENRSNYKIISQPWIRVTRGQVMLEKDCYIGKWKGGPDWNLNQNARNPSKLQASKAFCASYYPQVSFILEGLQRGLNARSRSIKHAKSYGVSRGSMPQVWPANWNLS